MNFGNKVKFFNYRPMVSVCLFFIAGIIFAVGLFVGSLYYFLLSVLMFVLFSLTLIFKAIKSKKNKVFKVLSIVIAFLLSFGYTTLILTKNEEKNNINGEFYVVGRVYNYVDTSDSGLKVVSLDNVKITDAENEESYSIKSNLRLYLEQTDGKTNNFELGEIVRGKVSLKKADVLYDNKVGFYLNNKNIYVIGFGTEDDISSTENFSKTIFDRIKSSSNNVLNKVLGKEYGGLGYAMLFGDKAKLDNKIYESYSNSGIAHLLAVSGLHVGFLVVLINFILKLFNANDKSKLIVTLIIVFLYAFMCGFSVSVTRAFIMTIVLLFSKLRKKKYDSLSSLAFAAIIILLWKPLFLFDVGFILSFTSVASIMLFSRMFTNVFSKFLHVKIASAISLSLSASIGTLITSVVSFEKISPFAVLTNVIVIPLASVAFMILFSCVLISLLIKPFGYTLILFKLIMSIVTGVSSLFGSIVLSNLSLYLSIALSVFLCVGVLFLSGFIFVKKKTKAITSIVSFIFSFVCLIVMFIC